MLLLGNLTYSQNEIVGKWESQETGNCIEIYNQNNMFFGEIIKVSDDEHQNEIGHILLNNLIFNISTKRYEGEVKSTSGMTANCEIQLINQSKFQLTVKKLFIRKTQIFIRIE
ncbi:MAG: DUF2147 domain-containing protein [Planctomycetia bacterium]|nr:DUF2147 domain-containing protein [Planctomycetia bacterium]